MGIEVYDVMRRAVVPLEPRDAGRISMYVCGPTVYGDIHIGNARTLLWFDVIRRYLRYRGFEVTYEMNYTDVDDKIIERARVERTSPEHVARKYTAAFERDMAALGAEPPDLAVKATDHIDDMIEAISGLIERGLAYQADGEVFFAVESFEGYGKLSRRSLDEMVAGQRVEPHAGKKNPMDFSLWKAAKPGEPSWDSPWGPGRPGWHIECSVMSTKYLGMGFDIHGGASDLTFPHHENEIAQAEGLTGRQPFVRHWLHAGLVQMESDKMSKSLGNIVLARDVVEAVGGQVARYWALMGSYRTQMVFSDEALADASAAHERWATFVTAARHVLGDDMPLPPTLPLREGDPPPDLIQDLIGIRSTGDKERDIDRRAPAPGRDEGAGAPFIARFIAAMDDDFNSAGAFAVLHELVREANRHLEGAQRGQQRARTTLLELTADFVELTSVLNFRFAEEDGAPALAAPLIDYLLELREQARAERAFERADAIRERLAQLGVTVEDTPAGARWRIGAAGGA